MIGKNGQKQDKKKDDWGLWIVEFFNAIVNLNFKINRESTKEIHNGSLTK